VQIVSMSRMAPSGKGLETRQNRRELWQSRAGPLPASSKAGSMPSC